MPCVLDVHPQYWRQQLHGHSHDMLWAEWSVRNVRKYYHAFWDILNRWFLENWKSLFSCKCNSLLFMLRDMWFYGYKIVLQPYKLQVQTLPWIVSSNDMHTFFDSSDMNIVFRSVPITILSFANSSWVAVSFSAPSTAALMAAILTKFARSDKEEKNREKLIGRTLRYFMKKKAKKQNSFMDLKKELLFNKMMGNSPAPLNPGVPRAIDLTSTSSANGLSCR